MVFIIICNSSVFAYLPTTLLFSEYIISETGISIRKIPFVFQSIIAGVYLFPERLGVGSDNRSFLWFAVLGKRLDKGGSLL